jgi:arsenite/tail-anchored protein-transporting ATPase
VLNIDPTAAAESYRLRVMAQMGLDASAQELDTVREHYFGDWLTAAEFRQLTWVI